jgi:prolyl oligopeptidase
MPMAATIIRRRSNRLPARFDCVGLTTEQFEAVSKDGTKIPYFVYAAKNSQARAHHALRLWRLRSFADAGYSANFGRLWLSKGGAMWSPIFAAAASSARPGMTRRSRPTARKPSTISRPWRPISSAGLTTPKQLGIMGGSNGGLLVSTVMTQPESVRRRRLPGAADRHDPLHAYRSRRLVDRRNMAIRPIRKRDAILKYSPYQNVKPDVKYPPVLFVTATSDDRVTPVHARKMAAKMIEQGHDVLFYENTDGGHAAAADHRQAAEMWALSFVYLREKRSCI